MRLPKKLCRRQFEWRPGAAETSQYIEAPTLESAAFVSYGGVGGARSAQELREIVIELQMAPIRSSVHLPMSTVFTLFQDGDIETALVEHDRAGKLLIADLIWWASSLKSARLATSI
jgi:NAD(P)H-dependent FMN reductase